MEGGVEIKRVGWVFVGGDYHYSNASKLRYKQQLQQKWRERLACERMSVNICQKAGAKKKKNSICSTVRFLVGTHKMLVGFLGFSTWPRKP